MRKGWRLCNRLFLVCGLFLLFGLVITFSGLYVVLDKWLFHTKVDELRNEFIEWGTLYQVNGAQRVLLLEFESEVANDGASRVLCQLINPRGRVLVSTSLQHWPEIPQLPLNMVLGEIRIQKLVTNGQEFLAGFYRMPDGAFLMHIACFQKERAFLQKYQQLALWTVGLLLLILYPLLYYLLKREISAVNLVAKSAQIASDSVDFSEPVATTSGSLEVRQLVHSYNVMQEKISALIGELKEVSNNIAHDMRSPLTRIRGLAETSLIRREPTIDQYREVVEQMMEESDRLISLINTMLEIAETEAGKLPDEVVDLRQMVEEAAEIFEVAAEMAEVDWMVQITSTPCSVHGLKGQLQRVLANLLDNALKFSRPGDGVLCELKTVGTQAVLTIADSGPGISEAEQAQVFDRFYRGDRSRSTPGNGLGLSYVKAVVKRHGGELTLKSKLGEGTEFVLEFPLVD